MELKFLCPYCSRKLKADEENSGKVVECPECKQEFRIPSLQSEASPLPSVPSEETAPSETLWKTPEPNLEGEHTCPVCWLQFDSGDIMHIAVHDSLRGDPVLGEDAQQRFLATRFNNAGQALDAMGLPCSEIACPHCRRKLPQGFLDMPHHIVSIVGDHAAGKSYYLGILTKFLPATLYRKFGIVFQDADPTGNAKLNEMRKTLFGAQTPAEAALKKTQERGEMYESLPRQGRTVLLPTPFVYTVSSEQRDRENFAVILYDIAGEYFQPGRRLADEPAALHVTRASGILYLFDPFNSPEFRRRIPDTADPQVEKKVFDQQDIIIAEMRSRIQLAKNLHAGEKIHTPIAFILGKFDAWRHLFAEEPLQDPITDCRLEQPVIDNNSDRLRLFLREVCPNIVGNLEALSENVRYFPVSSFGHTPLKIKIGSEVAYSPDPAKIEPTFVEVPLLWILSQLYPKLFERETEHMKTRK